MLSRRSAVVSLIVSFAAFHAGVARAQTPAPPAAKIEPAVFDPMLGVHAVGYALLGGLGTALGPLLGVMLDLGLLDASRLPIDPRRATTAMASCTCASSV